MFSDFSIIVYNLTNLSQLNLNSYAEPLLYKLPYLFGYKL